MWGEGIGARSQGRVTIGEAGAAFIKANETAELAEALKEKGALRNFPIQIQMRHGAGHPDDIE
jgi:hypothetical protein